MLNVGSNNKGVKGKMVPFCHVRWARWRCVWCSPWLAWTLSPFGKSAAKQNSSTCYYRSNKVTSNRLCNLYLSLEGEMRSRPSHPIKVKPLPPSLQTNLTTQQIYFISLSSPLLLFETRCALSFKRYRAWEIWHFCLTHRISEKQAHYRTLKGHKQQEI